VLEECYKNIARTTNNVKELKDYFHLTKQRLSDIQKDFSKRMQDVKNKIKDYKEKVQNAEGYELQLKLEYEIRLEINRLYSLKHNHESECSGLDKRLDELEAFNTGTEVMQSLLNYQIIQFFEKCEDKMLLQQRDSALIRLASILNAEVEQWKVAQGEEACKQIEKFYNLSIPSPISDASYKDFLHTNILSGRLALTQNHSTIVRKKPAPRR
jgi:vacuolar-type H+-ATPase subunit I/STV1